MRPVRLRNYIFYLLALTITLPLLVLSYSQYRMIEQERSPPGGRCVSTVQQY